MAEKHSIIVDKIHNINELIYVRFEGKFGGYKSSLLIDDIASYVRSFIICAYCEGVMRNPCGIGNPQTFVCSDCSKEDKGNPLSPDRDVVAQLQANCPLKERGCVWQGILTELEGHLEICPCYKVECDNDCGCIVERGELTSHLENECSLRKVCCEFCNEFYSFGDDNIHELNCLEALVHCPLACEEWIQRGRLQDHVNDICVNLNVGCPFISYGCCENVKVLRKDVDTHCKEFRVEHLEMKTEFLLEENQSLRTNSKFQQDIVNNLVTMVADPASVYHFICQSSYDSSHFWTLTGLSLIDSEWVKGPTFKHQSHSFRIQYKLEKSCIVIGISVILKYTNYFTVKFCTFLMCHNTKKANSHFEFIAEYYPENKNQSVVKNFLHCIKQIVYNIATIPLPLVTDKVVSYQDSVDFEIYFK
ncbi:TNF receptor-associated factor 4 [Oopsacas minuta]|uniref:TNF receptor-associated factor 4 n=1 Tax=Oopsacas minuta TaxID=111878 RepID=A0AAV7JPG2_9METZ|nr:TNF receptor-associated factor 4 [Oopsacas minuta]